MAILIDELMKDREMLGYYIIALFIGQDKEELTNERVGDFYDSIFGEQEDREVEEVMEKYKKQTEFT